MLILILAGIVILVLGLSIFLGNYIYYRIYPERKSVESYAHSTPPIEIINGDPGISGSEGIDNEKAVDGLYGPRGEKGTDGVSGQKSTVVGPTGLIGANGMDGPAGLYGISGNPGLPSNSSIPAVIQSYDQTYRITPIDIEHTFTLNNELYKLNIVFISDEISCFQFPPNEENQRYQIDSSESNTWIGVENGKSQKIYGQFKVALETSETEDADGKIFYVSPPINRDGYLIVLDKEPDSSSFLIADGLLEEKNVVAKRTFGFDFKTIDLPVNDHKYNYFLKGLFGYKVIVNIDPPIPTVFPRLVEATSSQIMGDVFLPTLNFSAKSGDMKSVSKNKIIMISPRFEPGLIIIKDSAETGSLWKQTKYTDFNTFFLEESPNKIVGAFRYLEEEADSFNEDGTDTVNSKLTVQNPSSLDSFVMIMRDDEKEPVVHGATDFARFNARGSLNKIDLVCSNEEFPLTLPSVMNEKGLYLAFVLAVKIKDFDTFNLSITDQNGVVYRRKFSSLPLRIVPAGTLIGMTKSQIWDFYTYYNPNQDWDRYFSDFLVGKGYLDTTNLPTIGNSLSTSETMYSLLSLEENTIYCPFTINLGETAIPFSSVYGRRLMISLSTESLTVSFNEDSIYDKAFDGFKGLKNLTNWCFGGNYFKGINISAQLNSFNFTASSSIFSVYGNAFRVGYTQDSQFRWTQCLLGEKTSDGNYLIDVPLTGYLPQVGRSDFLFRNDTTGTAPISLIRKQKIGGTGIPDMGRFYSNTNPTTAITQVKISSYDEDGNAEPMNRILDSFLELSTSPNRYYIDIYDGNTDDLKHKRTSFLIKSYVSPDPGSKDLNFEVQYAGGFNGDFQNDAYIIVSFRDGYLAS